MNAPEASVEPDTDAFLRALGKRVRVLRVTRELTQDQLADATGISRSFVSLIEHGTHGIDVVRLMRLAAAFDMALIDLLDLNQPVSLDRAAA